MARVSLQFRTSAIVTGIGLTLWMTACGAKNPEVVKNEDSSAVFTVPANPYADDAARFLAGMPGRAESPLKKREAEKQWQAHAAGFDAAFARWATVRQPPISAFQASELAGNEIESATAFYPFGGPDVVHLLTFYPKNPVYIMVGLEPPGTLPTEKRLRSAALEAQLPEVRRTLFDVLGKSFFITKEMDKQLRGQVTDGLLPIMLVQLVRSGAKILGTAPIMLDPKGTVVARDESLKNQVNRGVAIDYVMKSETKPHRIYFFSINLGDSRFAANESFKAFLAQQPRLVSMFKSTSYMPHRADFSAIREQVLQRSTAVVQDDSGIPFKFYEAAKWNRQLYGQYSKPYGSFRNLVQPDLQKAFADKAAVKPLAFNIGYGFNRIPSNLLIARKKT